MNVIKLKKERRTKQCLKYSSNATVLVGGSSQGWFPLTGLPWNLPPVPGICAGIPPTFNGTISQAHELAMSLTKEFVNVADI